MACCGQGRAALALDRASAPQVPAVRGPSVRIEFTEPTAVMIRGPATGRHYQFHPGAETQWVDPRDATSLMRSGYFRLAGD
jgi:hypothetical protein